MRRIQGKKKKEKRKGTCEYHYDVLMIKDLF